MIAGSPRFESRLKRRVRDVLWADRALWKEFKARAKSRKQQVPPWVLTLLFPLYVLPHLAESNRELFSFSLALSLYATGTALTRSGSLIVQLFASHEALVPFYLPMPDSEFLNLQLKRALRGSCWALFAFFTMYCAVLVKFKYGEMALLWAAAAALMQWLVIVALSLFFATAGYMRFNAWIGVALSSAAVLILLIPSLGDSVKGVPWQVLCIIPAGWVSAAFERGIIGGNSELLLLGCVPLLALLTIPSSLRRLRAMYQIKEAAINAQGKATFILKVDFRTLKPIDAAQIQNYHLKVQAAAGDGAGVGDARRTAEIEARIRTRSFMNDLDMQRLPAMERIIFAWLSVNERRLVEFLAHSNPGWTRAYKRLLFVLLVLTAVAAINAHAMLGILAVVGMFTWPLVIGSFSHWPGLRCAPCGGKLIPFYAAYPITFEQISRVYVVVNLMRCMALLPLALGFGALIAYAAGLRFEPGLIAATKAIALLMAAQPALAAIHIFNGTDRFERIDSRSAPYLLPTLMFGLFFTATAIGLFVRQDEWLVVCAILAVMSSGAFWMFSRHFYNRWSVDLVRQPA